MSVALRLRFLEYWSSGCTHTKETGKSTVCLWSAANCLQWILCALQRPERALSLLGTGLRPEDRSSSHVGLSFSPPVAAFSKQWLQWQICLYKDILLKSWVGWIFFSFCFMWRGECLWRCTCVHSTCEGQRSTSGIVPRLSSALVFETPSHCGLVLTVCLDWLAWAWAWDLLVSASLGFQNCAAIWGLEINAGPQHRRKGCTCLTYWAILPAPELHLK